MRRELVKTVRGILTPKTLSGKESPLKRVRDKLSAHIDPDTIIDGDELWGKVDVNDYIRIIRTCVGELNFLLQNDFYHGRATMGTASL